MIANRKGETAALVLYILVFSLSICIAVRGEASAMDDGVTVAQLSEVNANALQVTPGLQLALAALATCYCTGIDLIGGGHLQAGTDALHACFAHNAEFVYTFPPQYAALSFAVTGPEAFAQHVAALYQANGFVRTQHFVTNLRLERTGGHTAIIRGSLIAIHVFPDERVFFATATYVDNVRYRDGQWKIVHRDEPLTSLTLLPAFPIAP
jgi:hypothetical protein